MTTIVMMRMFYYVGCNLFVDAPFDFIHVSIDDSYGCDVDNVADRAFKVGKVNRFVQSHLDRTDNLGIRVKRLQQLVTSVGATHIGEDERIDVFAL